MQIFSHNKQGLNLFSTILKTLLIKLVFNDKYDLLSRLAEGEVTSNHLFDDDEGLELELLWWELVVEGSGGEDRGWEGWELLWLGEVLVVIVEEELA